MTICPKCSTEQPCDSTKFCGFCGEELPQKYNADDIDESKDFEISESLDNGVEPSCTANKPLSPLVDDLGIESNADLLETGAIPQSNSHTEDDGLIGQSWPPVGSYLEELESNNDRVPSLENNEPPFSEKITQIELNERRELESKLLNFENNQHHVPSNNYESKQNPVSSNNYEKPIKQPKEETKIPEVIKDSKPDLKQPIESIINKPKLTPRSRGIAYYYKNYIELVGKQPLFPEDEIEVGNRIYILKPKRVRPSFLYGGIAVILILLMIFIGSFFIDNTTGNGNIVGFVLDEYDQPYTESATIKFTDLGKEVITNPRGFFQLDNVPAGPTRIEYIVDNDVVKIDYVTVSANNTSTILLYPELNETEYLSEQDKKDNLTKTEADNSKSISDHKTTSANLKTNKSKIVLSANVENARLKLDGKIIGAGNITYSNIKPGVHTYTVSQDGYNEVEGSFHINSGEIKKLNITLVPLQSVRKSDSYQAEDYYFSAENLSADSKFEEAINNYTNALAIDPSYVKALIGRAEVYNILSENQKAHDDYLRAAEIFQINGDFIKSQTAYGNAILIDPKSVSAYLGRAALFLNNHEYRAALGDYDKVTKLDRRNFDAYYGMGFATFNQQRYKSAIIHFKDARSINDKNPLVYQYLMLSYMYLNDDKNLKKSYSMFLETASEEQLSEFQQSNNYSTIERLVN